MNDAPSDGSSTDTPLETVRPGPRNRLRVAVALTLMAAVVVLAVLARVGLFGQRSGQTASGSAAPSAVVVVPAPSESSSPSDEPGVLVPEPSFEPQPPTSPGLIAVVDDAGELWTMDDGGNFRVRYPGPGIVFGFPAWSPDGTKIAVVGQGLDDTGIYVFNVQPGGFEVPPMITANSGPDPVVIYRSADRPPFYLSWTPDGKAVGFLASEAVGISLRIAPADGSAPLDGSDPASIVRIGAPFYFDWLDAQRLLVHIDVGAAAFTGEVGLDGKPVRTALKGSGQFRSASHSRNGRYVAYVRSETDGSESLVVAARDGSTSHRLPVFGTAAFTFNPAGDTLAVIAAKESTTSPDAGIPFGPLQLINPASGAVRTLLNQPVVAFFWSPDGNTIAVLMPSQPGDDQVTAGIGAVLAGGVAPRSAPGQPGVAEGVTARLAFVDVATGAIRSQRVISLGEHFVNQLLPYFDQYALSHHLWSPDSRSILLPLVARGVNQEVIVPADGSTRRSVALGDKGFWSP